MASQPAHPSTAGAEGIPPPSQRPLNRRAVKTLDDLAEEEFSDVPREPDGSISAEHFLEVWRAREEDTRRRAAALTEAQLLQLGVEPDIAEVRRSINEPAPPPLKKICRGQDAQAYTKFYDEDEEGEDDVDVDEIVERAAAGQHTGLSRLETLMHALIMDDAPRKRERRVAFDLISSMGSNTILLVEMCKHLNPADIVNVYAISKVCHATIDSYLTASIAQWTSHACPEAARVFPCSLYPSMSVPDPMGRVVVETKPGGGGEVTRTRMAPSLRWYAMVFRRSRRARDILACLARNGHRTPRGAHGTLLRLWLVLDCATSNGRLDLFHCDTLFSEADIYNGQLFLTKLNMRFSDPVYGPRQELLSRLVLAQRGGMTLLWRMLRGDTLAGVREGRVPEALDPQRVVQMRVRYDVEVDDEWFHEAELPMLGVPFDEVGKGHTEGWGAGEAHLLRLDELLPVEAARRGLRLDDHLWYMAMWGHLDCRTGLNLVPSVDEMYMSDDELPPAGKGLLDRCGNVPFEQWEWQPWHSFKRRWNELSVEEKRAVFEAQQDEQLALQAWEHYSEFDSSEDDSEEDESVASTDVDLSGIGTVNDRLFNPSMAFPSRIWQTDSNNLKPASKIQLKPREQALVDQCVDEITRRLHVEDQRMAEVSLEGPYNENLDNKEGWEDVYREVKQSYQDDAADGEDGDDEDDGVEDDDGHQDIDEDMDEDTEEGNEGDVDVDDYDDDDSLTEWLGDELLDEPSLQPSAVLEMEKMEKYVFFNDFRRY
ncbi:uncharacterized protein E0L32_001882 [Thyridium curvatum]|uniref:Uncharacterized protein n=1 Tax=Thyridium curvatum TaxID=1093900 RepID=A0A507AM52_9PEZI|nr:uncharacterized protein E0L32_001797 [Thyridium curvatum]XP_030990018.1 uncharacterized protein E0L32_001882 [Thyridium curvatum]TPX08222.1 hypothetical protein E0L32_001797 [Thyridium curvatum]TPX08307.1 hypothetical protein E0L32_001882 [Thyridium curvatum]